MKQLTKIVFSDVDGTILTDDKQMTEKTRKAIKDLGTQGIPFVIISARSPSGIMTILRDNGFNCPIIAYSGALIMDEHQQVIYHQGMPKALAQEIVDFIEENKFDLAWNAFSVDEWIVKDKNDARVQNEERIVKAQSHEGTVTEAADDQINKLLCICNPEKIEEIEAALKQRFPMCSIAKSSDSLLEIMEQGMTKASGVKAMCELWQVPVENVAAFGDNYNDMPMLEAAGHGFLMGNAPEALKKRFSSQTLSNAEDGVYHALKHVLGWI